MQCLLDVKYQPTSRQSSVAIAFANYLVEELTTALPTQLSPPTTVADGAASTNTDCTADAQLNAIQLHRNHIHVCFDLLLHDCKPEIRRQVGKSVAQPIHTIVKSGDKYQVKRNPVLDRRVAET